METPIDTSKRLAPQPERQGSREEEERVRHNKRRE